MTTRLTRWLTALDNFEAKMAHLPAVRRYGRLTRATGLVLPIDGNGKLYVTGKYPLLNKKLERTGKYSSLATKGGEYTDYIYKNQYSAVAESRKLDGSKAWEGY